MYQVELIQVLKLLFFSSDHFTFFILGGSIRWDDLNWGKEYSPTGAYSQSKLANVLFTIELAKRLKGSTI
jgi:NAD(P)-dependent dehydrogenase (short-subunit alcohol dehydrogenase family)